MEKNLDLNYGKTVKANRRKTSEALWGIFCVAPLSIGLLMFLAAPLFYSLYISLCDYNLVDKPVLTPGIFDNFVELFVNPVKELAWSESNAGKFWISIGNAFVMSIGVLISMGLALITANLLCGKIKLTNLFKSIFFIPTICSSVATTIMWKRMYEFEYGTINLFLKKLNLVNVGINWLDKEHVVGSIIFMTVLFGFGTSMLLYYSAIKGVPKSYYEAADMDGANAFQKFFYITIPSVSSITFYILVTGIIGSLQGFAVQKVMTNGNTPGTSMPVLLIYKCTSGEFGGDAPYGLASAMGIILGIIIAIITGINFLISNKWVHYES